MFHFILPSVNNWFFDGTIFCEWNLIYVLIKTFFYSISKGDQLYVSYMKIIIISKVMNNKKKHKVD